MSFRPFDSILEPTIVPYYERFYPPAILIKHHIWYHDNADFFISLQGILYGLHRQYFEESTLFQEIIRHGEDEHIGLIPILPIPFDTLKPKIFDVFVALLYHDSTLLERLTFEDWIDVKRLSIDWYFPRQTHITVQRLLEIRQKAFSSCQRSWQSSSLVQRVYTEYRRRQQPRIIVVEDSYDQESSESEQETISCVEDDSI